jgi:hypothetical protein
MYIFLFVSFCVFRGQKIHKSNDDTVGGLLASQNFSSLPGACPGRPGRRQIFDASSEKIRGGCVCNVISPPLFAGSITHLTNVTIQPLFFDRINAEGTPSEQDQPKRRKS